MKKSKKMKLILEAKGSDTIVAMEKFEDGMFIATNKKIYAIGDEPYLDRFKSWVKDLV